jgi:D-threo-aldose 1-dehydrogenase
MTFDAAERNRVGTRDVLVSRLGIGTSPFGTLVAAQDDEVVAATMEAAAAAGLRYFDTAPFYGYGLAEHRLGQGLRGTVRDEVVLSTKVGRLFKPSLTSPLPATRGGERPFAMVYDYTYDATLRSIEDSLLRLDSGRIDIALIHDVNRRWQGDQLEARYREAMAGAYSALDALRAQGVIKAIGVGVNDWEILLRFAADGDFDCFMLAGRYTLLDHSAIDRFLPECARRGIAVLAAAPYNSGILATGARPGATFFYTEATPEIMERTRRIEAVCARHGVPLPAAALQFASFHPAVASIVVGMRNATDIVENVAYFRHPIPAQFWQELKAHRLIADAAPTSLTV